MRRPTTHATLIALLLASLFGGVKWALARRDSRSEQVAELKTRLEGRERQARAREAQDASFDRASRDFDDRVDALVREARERDDSD